MENREKIIRQVTSFIEGGDRSSLEMLNMALHEKFSNVQNGFFDQKGIFVIDKDKYLSLISDHTFGGIPRKMEIVSLDIVGNIAMVKAHLRSEQLTFISFISLVMDEHREWKVIGNFPFVEAND
ncbi:MAG: nuclear transport factor 2 family protein [Bacteroidota bacterium]